MKNENLKLNIGNLKFGKSLPSFFCIFCMLVMLSTTSDANAKGEEVVMPGPGSGGGSSMMMFDQSIGFDADSYDIDGSGHGSSGGGYSTGGGAHTYSSGGSGYMVDLPYIDDLVGGMGSSGSGSGGGSYMPDLGNINIIDVLDKDLHIADKKLLIKLKKVISDYNAGLDVMKVPTTANVIKKNVTSGVLEIVNTKRDNNIIDLKSVKNALQGIEPAKIEGVINNISKVAAKPTPNVDYMQMPLGDLMEVAVAY